MDETSKRALALHRQFKGKVGIALKDEVDSMEKLSLYYTPGVAAVSRQVAEYPETTREYTNTNNSVAIVSNGSAVLGLGDIGPEGALPVMEGKAMLFKSFAGVDGIPIVLNAKTPDEIVATVKAIAPSFGGINLEDIKAPECFEVERRLKEELSIPVFHDDQHGTAVVVLAGIINALKIVERSIKDEKIVIVGAGAAGVATAHLLAYYGAGNIVVVDSKGIISSKRGNLSTHKQELLKYNLDDNEGGLDVALKDAGTFVGVSKGGLLTEELVRSMCADSIIFAMANPDPEILPDEAHNAGAAVVATGRSGFPNQVNNALAFPGIFRGALDNQVRMITDDHKVAASHAIAGLVRGPTPERIIPDIFTPGLSAAVAEVIKEQTIS